MQSFRTPTRAKLRQTNSHVPRGAARWPSGRYGRGTSALVPATCCCYGDAAELGRVHLKEATLSSLGLELGDVDGQHPVLVGGLGGISIGSIRKPDVALDPAPVALGLMNEVSVLLVRAGFLATDVQNAGVKRDLDVFHSRHVHAATEAGVSLNDVGVENGCRYKQKWRET